MLVVLALIDVVMISNLLIMVIVGGYETFVSRMNLEGHPDQPEWLSHVNASVLKVKLATAIIGISSIHLLKTFINADNYTDKVLISQTAHPHHLPAVGDGDRLHRQDPALHGHRHRGRARRALRRRRRRRFVAAASRGSDPSGAILRAGQHAGDDPVAALPANENASPIARSTSRDRPSRSKPRARKKRVRTVASGSSSTAATSSTLISSTRAA